MNNIFEIINKISRDTRIKHSEFRIFMILISYNTFRKIFPSLETISKDTGIKSIPDISKKLQNLSKYGYIKIIRRKHQSNIYEIMSLSKETVLSETIINAGEGKKKPEIIEIPDNLDNDAFIKVWNKWKAFRKEIKKPLKPTTEKEQLKFLANEPEPIEIIENSLRNGYQGLFKLKTNFNYNGNKERRNKLQEYKPKEAF
jgi:hypothetical protein